MFTDKQRGRNLLSTTLHQRLSLFTRTKLRRRKVQCRCLGKLFIFVHLVFDTSVHILDAIKCVGRHEKNSFRMANYCRFFSMPHLLDSWNQGAICWQFDQFAQCVMMDSFVPTSRYKMLNIIWSICPASPVDLLYGFERLTTSWLVRLVYSDGFVCI